MEVSSAKRLYPPQSTHHVLRLLVVKCLDGSSANQPIVDGADPSGRSFASPTGREDELCLERY